VLFICKINKNMKKERLCIQRDENWKSKLLKEDPYIYAKKIFFRVCQVKCVSFFRYHKRRCVTSDCWL
jgi:hypothetical protein